MKSIKSILKEIKKEEDSTYNSSNQALINLSYWVPKLRKSLIVLKKVEEGKLSNLDGWKQVRTILNDSWEQTK